MNTVSQVTIAGLLDKNVVNCSRQVMIMPDKALSEVADNKFDVVILPGGLKGANSLAAVSSHHFTLLIIRIPNVTFFILSLEYF